MKRPATMKRPGKLRLYYHYFRYLLWEFRWSLTVFWSLVFGGGLLLHTCYRQPLGFLEACQKVFFLIFVEDTLAFPEKWYLQPLVFIIPIIGLGAVADSVIRLGYMIFTRKQNLPEWHRMVASLYSNHIVVVGVGKVGFRIIEELVRLRQAVVAVERTKESSFLDEVFEMQVPVIQGDGRIKKVLEEAGTVRARSIILATDDDLTNIDSALTAQDLNPDIRPVLRLFDDTLADKVAGAFHMPAISTSRVSMPAFIKAALDRKVYQEFELAGQELRLVDMTIHPGGRLVGMSVGELQGRADVNVVMRRCSTGVSINPNGDLRLAADDILLVIAQMEKLLEVEELNRPPVAERLGPRPSA